LRSPNSSITMALQPPNHSTLGARSVTTDNSVNHSIYGTIPRKPIPEKRSHTDIYGTITRKPLAEKHSNAVEQIYGTIPRRRPERDRERERDKERDRERRERDKERDRERRERERDRLAHAHARDIYGTIPRKPKDANISRSTDIYGTISRKPRLSVDIERIQSPQEKLADLLNRDLMLDHNYGSSFDKEKDRDKGN